MKYNFKVVIVSTLLCLLICCNAEAMHKHHIHNNNDQQPVQYKNTLNFNKINIDVSNTELEKYAYNNR